MSHWVTMPNTTHWGGPDSTTPRWCGRSGTLQMTGWPRILQRNPGWCKVLGRFILLMVQKSQTTTVWMYKPVVNNGISTTVPSTGEFVRFLNHQQYPPVFFGQKFRNSTKCCTFPTSSTWKFVWHLWTFQKLPTSSFESSFKKTCLFFRSKVSELWFTAEIFPWKSTTFVFSKIWWNSFWMMIKTLHLYY